MKSYSKQSSQPSETSSSSNASNDLTNVHLSEQLFIGEPIPNLLPCKHWLETLDPKHRYGTYLRPYFDSWCSLEHISVDVHCPEIDADAFFKWLDHGGGKDFDLSEKNCEEITVHNDKSKSLHNNSKSNEQHHSKIHNDHFDTNVHKKQSTAEATSDESITSWYLTCPSSSSCLLSSLQVRKRHVVSRNQLENSRVTYCDEAERKWYEVETDDKRKVRWMNRPGKPYVDTHDENRWIFVIDENLKMFINKKRKASFHHSSFVGGNPVRAAGRIDIIDGEIQTIAPNSGHYLTSMFELLRALSDFFGCCTLPIASFREDLL